MARFIGDRTYRPMPERETAGNPAAMDFRHLHAESHDGHVFAAFHLARPAAGAYRHARVADTIEPRELVPASTHRCPFGNCRPPLAWSRPETARSGEADARSRWSRRRRLYEREGGCSSPRSHLAIEKPTVAHRAILPPRSRNVRTPREQRRTISIARCAREPMCHIRDDEPEDCRPTNGARRIPNDVVHVASLER